MYVSGYGDSETEQRHSFLVTMTLPPPCNVYKSEVDKADEHIEDGEEDEEMVDEGSFLHPSIVTA